VAHSIRKKVGGRSVGIALSWTEATEFFLARPGLLHVRLESWTNLSYESTVEQAERSGLRLGSAELSLSSCRTML
jgi:hypothetical protein